MGGLYITLPCAGSLFSTNHAEKLVTQYAGLGA